MKPEDFLGEYRNHHPDAYTNLIPLLFQLRDMLPTIKCPDCGHIGQVTHLQIGPTATTGKCRNCQNVWTIPGEFEEGQKRWRLHKQQIALMKEREKHGPR
jgi:predicted Zn finger-like uncharacterized protein